VARHHDGSTGVEGHLNAGNRSANARVFCDIAGIVLRHVQIGANENSLTFDFALLAQI
jgi:hypothetical protein